MRKTAEQIQEEYYRRTASAYDSMHNNSEDHEHTRALSYIDAVGGACGFRTFLDVGSGTGRALRFLSSPGRDVHGIEPVAALIEQAEAEGLAAGSILQGSGYALPFPDDAFDVALECGVLHHVAEPARVVAEMIRVAKWAVFLSDSNRFGQGRMPARLLKLALCRMSLWRAARFLQTKGKMYTISEGDGLAYSYSVFDSFDQLASVCQQIWPVPTAPMSVARSRWAHPLLTSSHVLLCAFKPGALDRMAHHSATVPSSAWAEVDPHR